jgi:TolB-like protein
VLTQVTAPADVPAARHPPRRPTHVVGAAAAVAAVLLGLLAWQARGPAPDIAAELAQRRSIAVMPFTDLSEPKAPHVAYAVDQALSTDLGRLDDTTVIARESSATLGTSETVDPQRAGRELGVRHLLAGSVRLEGSRLVVNVRLLRADTGALLWSDRFDYPSVADWAVQADILARVANEMDTKVGKTIVEQAARSPHSGRAIDHWMRGRHIMWTVSSHDKLIEARQHFDAALDAQPQSVHAMTGLAFTHIVDVIHRWSRDPKQSLATAQALARRALDIAPDNHAALKALAGAQMFAGDIAGSMGTTQRLLALNPNDAHANRDLAANLFFQGRWQESLRQLAVAERLNPLDASHMWKVNDMATVGLIATHRYDEAIERARRNAVLHPSSIGPLALVAAAEAHRGNLPAASAVAAEVIKRDPAYFVGKGRGTRGSTAPAYLQGIEHVDAGLRLAGLPATPPGPPP